MQRTSRKGVTPTTFRQIANMLADHWMQGDIEGESREVWMFVCFEPLCSVRTQWARERVVSASGAL